VAYEPRAIAFTEAPSTDHALRRQRLRWARGGFQVLKKYRSLLGDASIGMAGLFWLPYSALTWFGGLPITILLTILAPVLVWGSGAPVQFLVCLGFYALAGVILEFAKLIAAVALTDLGDAKFLPDAIRYLAYKKLRLDWFSAEALYQEWRQKPKGWHV
jgi:cellulose synthase/poly-beta-1,6-N-acetylglucosamine synthase-like glycosyltransferase